MQRILNSHGRQHQTLNRLDLRVWMIACIVSTWAATGLAYSAEAVPESFSAAKLHGGVIVRLGVEDGEEIAALRCSDTSLVQGLDTDYAKVSRAKEHLSTHGMCGVTTAREFDGLHLPYIDNLVNSIVVANRFDVSESEILRVLVPGGQALFIDPDSKSVQQRLTKPHPAKIDEWTHYLYDAGNNAVSQDTRIDSIARQQWVGGPRWSRHHDHIAGLTAMVSTAGRIFYVMDEGKTSSILLPPKHFLVARDAYNGTILWKKPLPSWHPHLWPLKSGPAQLPRRLVANGQKVYLPLGMAEPLSVLDAASGEILRTFPETRATEEILFADGTLFVLANPEPEMYEDFTLGNAHNGTQKGRVARDYLWNKSPRTLVVLDEESGEIRWQKQVIAAPLSLTIGKECVFFFNGSKIVALDRIDGTEQWRSDQLQTKRAFAINESPILVAYENYVLFAGANGRMNAFAAETGEQLWETEHLRGGYCSPQDLFVIDDTVWSGAIATPRDSGHFAGRDLQTGELSRDVPATDVPYTFGHHRCHRAKATARFILSSKTGIEFYDIENCNESLNHWVRGGCLYGIMPANGLIYAPMHSCACHLDSKLTGFNALAPRAHEKTKATSSPRLQKGEAYAAKNLKTATDSDWPTYRADNGRSSFSPASVKDSLSRKWQTSLKGKLTALTIGSGKVFVAAVDEHRLYALDHETGAVAWSFIAGARIDSPPTIFRGRVYFGCANGHVYALSASDGKLAWRFRLAPDDSQLCCYGQLESVWPVHGSVTIKNGKLFCVGGRSSFLDGGLPFARLDALTGELEAESILDDHVPGSDVSMQFLSEQSIMPSAIPDILSSDGQNLFMRVEKLSDDGKRIGSFAYEEERQYEGRHIFSWAGFLEDSWLHRIYMSYGNGKLPRGTYLNWWTYGERNPDGRILVMDDDTIYSYGLKPKYHAWSSTFLDYQLYSVNKTIETQPTAGPTIFDKPTGRTPKQQLRYNWTAAIPFYVRAMVKASDKLVLCGPEKIIDEKGVISRYPEKSVLRELEQQEAILDGQQGCHLWVVSAGDGRVLEKLELPTLPVFDGMAAEQGRIYLATRDGVVCLEGAKKQRTNEQMILGTDKISTRA